MPGGELPGSGVKLTLDIRPKNDADFPMVQDGFLYGGFRAVVDVPARDAIPAEHRKLGMWVYVLSTGQTDTLLTGLTNGDWELAVGPPGAGGDHATLSNLSWDDSGHVRTGASDRFAGFDAGGAADGLTAAEAAALLDHDQLGGGGLPLRWDGGGHIGPFSDIGMALLDDGGSIYGTLGAGFLLGTPVSGIVDISVAIGTEVQGYDAATVIGPPSSTDNAVARFNGTGGASIQNSGVLIDDSDNITGVSTLETLNVNVTGSAIRGVQNNSAVGRSRLYTSLFSARGDTTENVYMSLQNSTGEVGRIRDDGAGGVGIFNESDRRLKRDVTPAVGLLDKALAVGVYDYGWSRKPGRTTGVMADEVFAVWPAAADDPNTLEADESAGVSYAHLGVLALGAVRELSDRVVALEARLAKLEAL